MKNKFQPYGINIQIQPESKNKIIGDTSKYFLHGKVLAKGNACSELINVGDILAFTLWGLNKVEKDGEEYFFVQENSDFILGIIKND